MEPSHRSAVIRVLMFLLIRTIPSKCDHSDSSPEFLEIKDIVNSGLESKQERNVTSDHNTTPYEGSATIDTSTTEDVFSTLGYSMFPSSSSSINTEFLEEFATTYSYKISSNDLIPPTSSSISAELVEEPRSTPSYNDLNSLTSSYISAELLEPRSTSSYNDNDTYSPTSSSELLDEFATTSSYKISVIDQNPLTSSQITTEIHDEADTSSIQSWKTTSNYWTPDYSGTVKVTSNVGTVISDYQKHLIDKSTVKLSDTHNLTDLEPSQNSSNETDSMRHIQNSTKMSELVLPENSFNETNIQVTKYLGEISDEPPVDTTIETRISELEVPKNFSFDATPFEFANITIFNDSEPSSIETTDLHVWTSYPNMTEFSNLTIYNEQEYSGNFSILPIFFSESVLGDAVRKGREFADKLFQQFEPNLARKGVILSEENPAFYVALLSQVNSKKGRKLTRKAVIALEATAQLARRFELNGEQVNSLQSLDVGTCDPDSEDHEPCPPFSRVFRTPDGRCNNLRHPSWGKSLSPFRRWLPPDYGDGVSSPRTTAVSGFKLPSARKISRVMGHQEDIQDEEDAEATLMLMQWGQLVDHDLTRGSVATGFRGTKIRCCGVASDLRHPACFPISVQEDDPLYGRGSGADDMCLEFVRSSPAPRSGRCPLGPLEQMNQVTAYLDGSTVYGSSSDDEARLRLFRKGMLRETDLGSRKPLLPTSLEGHGDCRDNQVERCFQAGDSRVNEQPGLTAMHTLLVREHNRIAFGLAGINPHWGDERLYQESRRLVGAIIQRITYGEFLPAVLGQTAMRLYNLTLAGDDSWEGTRRPSWVPRNLYDPVVHAGIANVFSTAAFRFGHSLVHRVLRRFAKDHRPVSQGGSDGGPAVDPPPLHAEFFRPSGLWSPGNLDRLLLGLVNEASRRMDSRMTLELSGNLFKPSSSSAGTDLFAINVQRARDHGLPPYTSWRGFCGFRRVMRFVDLRGLMSDPDINRLSQLYRSVEDLDLFPAALSEFPVTEGMVGPTLACLIARQFASLRQGDRFWFENAGEPSSFTSEQVSEIQKASLSRLLCDNLDDADTVQLKAMRKSHDHRNPRVKCHDRLQLPSIDLEHWRQ